MNTSVWILVFIIWANSPPTEIYSIAEYSTADECYEKRNKIDLAGLGKATCVHKTKSK